jgi:hypothetical protein
MAALTVNNNSLLRISTHRLLLAPNDLVLKGQLSFETLNDVRTWQTGLTGNWTRTHAKDPNAARKGTLFTLSFLEIWKKKLTYCG